MGYFVSFPKQALEPKDISRFDDTIASTLSEMDDRLALRLREYLASKKCLDLPSLMATTFKNLSAQSMRSLTWDVVVISAHGGVHRHVLLDFAVSNASQVKIDRAANGLHRGYERSCHSHSCASGHQTSFSHGSLTAEELLADIHRYDVAPDLVPEAIFDATLEIAYSIDLMRGEGIFDPELKLIEKTMERLKKPAPFHRVEIISRLSEAKNIIAVHPTAEIHLHGYGSHLGEFSSQSEMAKAEGRDPADWMGIRYLLPCPECHGTGIEQTP